MTSISNDNLGNLPLFGGQVTVSQAKTKRFFSLDNPGLILIQLPSALYAIKNTQALTNFARTVIWDLLVGIPLSYALTVTNKHFIQWLGYEKVMRCPSGILASRCLMIAVHWIIIWSWRKQLIEEEKERCISAEVRRLMWQNGMLKIPRLMRRERQIMIWDAEIERLRLERLAVELKELENNRSEITWKMSLFS